MSRAPRTHPMDERIMKHREECDQIRERIRNQDPISTSTLLLFGYLFFILAILVFLFFMTTKRSTPSNGNGLQPPKIVEPKEETTTTTPEPAPAPQKPVYTTQKVTEYTDALGNPVDPSTLQRQGRSVQYVDVEES